MAKISSPYAVPDKHVALMGRVADTWAQLEFQIDQGIWYLAGPEQQLIACITAQLISVHPRLRAFTALVAIRGGSEQSVRDLNTFTGNVSGLSDQRNRTVHDPRFVDKATGEVHRLEITARPKVQFGFLPEPASQLEERITRISERVFEFIELRDRIISEIDGLPPESQPILQRIVPVPQAPQDRPTGE